MKQRQREQVQRGCAVGTVVLLAWLCRVLPLEGMPSGLQEACGILRSLLYLSLFAGWGISLYNRTVQDAKLIQTGTSGWLADLMLGAGMVLSAAGYWMERKRKAMFYKSQH